MTAQRRRGPLAIITPLVQTTNNRGEIINIPGTVTIAVRGALVNAESGSLQVPGKLDMRSAEFHVAYDLDPSVGVGSLVELNGIKWEVIAPPVQHGSHRQTRHTVLRLREVIAQ